MWEGCMGKGKHREGDETLCTLDAFREIVEKVRPVNWKEECRVRGTSFRNGGD
jgi:acid phosphatase